MAKFKIVFEHTIKQTFETVIEAESEKEAELILEEDPFLGIEDQMPSDEQGLSINIIEVEEV